MNRHLTNIANVLFVAAALVLIYLAIINTVALIGLSLAVAGVGILAGLDIAEAVVDYRAGRAVGLARDGDAQ